MVDVEKGRCFCGEKFRDGEDFRDHLPCEGPREQSWLLTERARLLDQIETGGCAAAHIGERTYECRVDTMCGLCRLRQRAERAEEALANVLDVLANVAGNVWCGNE